MYPIPHELETKIRKLLKGLRLSAKVRDALYERIVDFVVRENRELRQEVLTLGRNLAASADQEEEDYGDSVASYAGEETCLYINEHILRALVYVNTEETQQRKADVEKFIKKLFDEDGS